ncbi:MAG: ubiquitin-like protein Pup [Actinobacteria bacterium]|nr:MAG: ubiquitin-like protein Pup [Actinomycetota bacterium]
MAGQEHVAKPTRDTQDSEDASPQTSADSEAEARNAAVDDLLDEIDDVLETNAEEFVAAFVQKGGQ